MSTLDLRKRNGGPRTPPGTGWCQTTRVTGSCKADDHRRKGRVWPHCTLTVWAFDDVGGADRAIETLKSLQTQQLINIQDAAVVTWEAGKKKPKTRQLNNLAGAGAMGGAFWGMLFGLLFLVPLLGAAIGAAAGALSGSLVDVGIDDKFIDGVKQQVTPGTSALFVLTSGAVPDRIKEALKDTRPQLIASNLSADQETKLREVFADE